MTTVTLETAQKELQNLIQYIARCPFSIGRMLKVTDNGQVIYRTEQGGCYKFPKPADRDLKAAPARNVAVPLGHSRHSTSLQAGRLASLGSGV